MITSGTAVVAPDPAGGETEEDAPLSETLILKDRIRLERRALQWSNEGVRVSAIRLAPYVYGLAGNGFMPMLMQLAVKAGESVYVDEGALRTSYVYVDDAAELFLLAAERAKAGEVFNGAAGTSVTKREVAGAIGEVLGVPVRSVPHDDAEKHLGHFAAAVDQHENRASNRKAVEQLG